MLIIIRKSDLLLLFHASYIYFIGDAGSQTSCNSPEPPLTVEQAI